MQSKEKGYYDIDIDIDEALVKMGSEEYDSKLRVEWYLFADEAKEKGFCDHILGVDCELDDIV